MKLRHLMIVGLTLTLMVLLGLGIYGFAAWRGIERQLDEIAELNRDHHDLNQMIAAIDYSTLVRTDSTVVAGMIEHAGQLRERLSHIDHRRARLATGHLREIVAMGQQWLEAAPGDILDEDSRSLRDARVLISREIRIHHAGAREAIAGLVREANEEVLSALYRAVSTLSVALALFALLLIATSLLVYFRLVRPARQLNQRIRAFSRGDSDARLSVRGEDEFAELARSFNDMADQRQRHEQQLAESEERFRQIAENIGEIFWISEPDGSRLRYVCPAVIDITGYSAEEILERPDRWTDFIDQRDRERALRALGDYSEGPVLVEYRIVRADGQVRWLLDRAVPMYDASGEISHVIGVARDITERIHYQSQLTERLKELRCLYQVLELTTDRGLSDSEVAQRVADLLPGSMQYEQQAVARIILEDIGEFRSEAWEEPAARISGRIRIDGDDVGTVEVGYTAGYETDTPGSDPFLDEERTLINGVATHIARMIRQRRMAQSLARSERLKAVGELTGGIAHDFNNLLTVIIGNAQLLEESLSSDQAELAGFARMISAAGEQGAELTQRLLAFARRQALEPVAVDINELVQGLAELLERSLGESIELVLDFDPEPVPAMVDRAQLESALLNLCLNARDAMPDGGRLVIETETVAIDEEYAAQFEEFDPGTYVLLAVSDTGSGIDPAHLSRVFEPFFSTKPTGTGLGLSMVYGLIRQLHGHVRIYSEPGQGSTVRLYLPTAAAGEAPVPRDSETPQDLEGSETILLVEDSELVKRYATQQLRQAGYRVIEAGSGAEALAILSEREDIDLLFTDVIMPGGMNGRQLAEKAERVRPGLRVLYTSGYTENAIVHHGRLDPGVALLAKPYHRRELLRRVRAVIDQD